jgi:uncharacterized protein
LRIMVDTNVVISALLKQGSVPDIVLNDVCENHDLILCDQIISESYAVARRRFPNKVYVLEDLFAKLRYELVSAPSTSQLRINDIKDQPILNAAMTHNVDILITGDRHFLELDPVMLQIITPSEYKEKYINTTDL